MKLVLSARPFQDNFASEDKYDMETKILISKEYCEMDAIRYVASRYGTTPEKVLEHYFIQTGMINAGRNGVDDYKLQSNELALFHDLGVQPTSIEIG